MGQRLGDILKGRGRFLLFHSFHFTKEVYVYVCVYIHMYACTCLLHLYLCMYIWGLYLNLYI